MHIFHFYFSCGYKKVIKKYILVYEYFQPNKRFLSSKMREEISLGLKFVERDLDLAGYLISW